METYEFKGTKLRYEISGKGRIIVFIHGWGLDHNMWKSAVEKLFSGSEKFRRVYLDLPGMGESVPGKDFRSSDDTLELLHGFVRDVLGGEKIILAGQSYGGFICRSFLHQNPELVDGIILLCPLVFPGWRKGRYEKLCVKVRDDEFLATLSEKELKSFTEMNVILTRDVWNRYRSVLEPALEKADWNFLSDFEGACSFDPDDMAAFEGPALFVTGKQDTEVGYRDQFELLKNYPRASYHAVEGAGHNLQIEQPEIFESIVSDWIKRI